MTVCKLTHQAVLEPYQFILSEVRFTVNESVPVCQGLQEEMKLYGRF